MNYKGELDGVTGTRHWSHVGQEYGVVDVWGETMQECLNESMVQVLSATGDIHWIPAKQIPQSAYEALKQFVVDCFVAELN